MPQGYLSGLKLWTSEVHKTGSYTVLASDIGTLFIVDSGTPVFTLPSLATAAGFFGFFVNVSTTAMAITAPSGKLIVDGSAGATTGTYGTSSHIIGSACMVFINDAGTFYHLVNVGGTVVTTT